MIWLVEWPSSLRMHRLGTRNSVVAARREFRTTSSIYYRESREFDSSNDLLKIRFIRLIFKFSNSKLFRSVLKFWKRVIAVSSARNSGGSVSRNRNPLWSPIEGSHECEYRGRVPRNSRGFLAAPCEKLEPIPRNTVTWRYIASQSLRPCLR